MKLEFFDIKSAADFYGQLKRLNKLNFFGDNLDALHDYLTTELEGPAELRWKTYSSDMSAHPKLKTLAAVLLGAAAERADLKVILN